MPELLPDDPAPATPPAATTTTNPSTTPVPAAAADGGTGSPPPSPVAADGGTGEPPPDPNASLVRDPENEFLASLPEDLRKHPALAKYTSWEGVARGYVNAEMLLGRDKVPIPRDENDTEAWDRYYKAGGRPDDPSQYEIKKPETLPDGVQWDGNLEGWWRQAAFSAGLNKRQAAKLVDQYKDNFLAQVDANNKAAQRSEVETKSILRRDWASRFEAKRTLANAAFAEMPPELQEWLLSVGASRKPEFLKYLADTREQLTGEPPLREGGQSRTSDTPAELEAKIAQFRKDNEAALRDVSHPEHDIRFKELTDLHNRLYPEQAA